MIQIELTKFLGIQMQEIKSQRNSLINSRSSSKELKREQATFLPLQVKLRLDLKTICKHINPNTYSDKVLADLIQPEKRIFNNTNGNSTKKGTSNGTIRLSSKPGEEGIGPFILGLPGQIKNVVTGNSVGLIAVAEGDVISFVNSNAASSIGAEPNIILKSVGIGFSITRMSFHPNNDGLLVVHGNKQCIIINLDVHNLTNSSQNNGVKVLQTIKLDLMLDQLGGDLFIVQCCWLPNSQTHLCVLTKMFLKIYDLSKDTLSPVYCMNEIQDETGISLMSCMTVATTGNSTSHRYCL